ncbi:MAG: hypothetical protein OFPI_14050 [Osedax symbiont Rs2]|nr:MAG: hypothetical protein OFPI_14050 [Osedax symbiont Rs2]
MATSVEAATAGGAVVLGSVAVGAGVFGATDCTAAASRLTKFSDSL